jgi:hypothetical protein
MAKKQNDDSTLLRWSKHVPASEVQDPLGLALRGSARLASRLLYCITSITPRARYFSFLPWCVLHYGSEEKGTSHALGLWEGIALRERVLTLGCVAHHEGHPCLGGALVGSQGAQRWLRDNSGVPNLAKLSFAQNPALSAYYNSLANLGFFKTAQELSDSDQESESNSATFDDIELSELGLRVSNSYDAAVGRAKATKQIAEPSCRISIRDLADFGRRGGLCELREERSPDKMLLRDIFFDKVNAKGESHRVRRASLLLILEMCRQLSPKGQDLNASAFGQVTYYGVVYSSDTSLPIAIPSQLQDIATRWRMFYFHHYMAVALEGLFAWVVTSLGDRPRDGTSIDTLVARLQQDAVRRDLADLIGTTSKERFGQSTPARLLGYAGATHGRLDEAVSQSIDSATPPSSPRSEYRLETVIRTGDYLHSATGLALPLILLAVTLSRFVKWEKSNYGTWLATIATDPYLDLVPPLLLIGLNQKFGDWWSSSWTEIAKHVLTRYVVRQHLTMSYEKSFVGDRCLLEEDGAQLFATGAFDTVGMGNVRFSSARQILIDLGLVIRDEEGVSGLTDEGTRFLSTELRSEEQRAVS